MNFKYIVLSILLLTAQVGFSQSKIMGKILDSDEASIPGANIILTNDKQEQRGVTSDLEGNFSIDVKENGTYRIQATFIGYETYDKVVTVRGNEDVDLGLIVLRAAAELLQSVEVIGRKRQDYNSDYSFSATKIAIENRELPQSVATITKELIDDKVAFQLSDAVKGVSSVTPVSFYSHFNIRGITQNEDGQIINGMRTHQYYFLQPLTQNIERIEVVKGPSSVTFSSADPGGTINMVTKKPLRETRREVSFGAGSFNTIRGGLDFTGPLNEEKTLLYRINAAIQKANSFRDLVQNDALLISPSFSYIPNDKTAVNAEMIYSNSTGNLDRGQPIFDEVTSEDDLNSTPISRNIAASNDYNNSKEFIITTSLSHRFTDNIQFNAKYMKQIWEEDLQEHRANGFIADVDGNTVPNLVRFRYAKRNQFWNTDNLNAFLTFDNQLGEVENKLLVGYDLHQFDKTIGGSQNGARGYLTDAEGNSLTESYGDIEILSPAVGYFDLDNPSNITRNTNAYNIGAFAIPAQLLTTNAAYIQNVTKFKGFTLLLSLRQEWFEDDLNYDNSNRMKYNNTALIPRVGLSYKINNNFNVYATYLEGFQPQMNTVNLMPITANNFFWSSVSPSEFDPLESDLIEFGLKGNLFNEAINVSVAGYQVNQRNILMSIPDNDAPGGFVFTQRGADQSRGIELDVSGYVLPNLQMSASYAYTNAIIKEDENLALIGERKEAAPINSANLWAKYDFENTVLPGVSFGAGIQYSGDKLGWYDRNLVLPDYTVVDAALYYRPNAYSVEFTLKVNNLLNTTYWTGAINNTRVFPGVPRNFMFVTAYKF